MVKDLLFKRLFIPVAGFVFPFLSGLVSFGSTPVLQLLLACVFFTGIVFLQWHGVVKITTLLRTAKRFRTAVFSKLAALVLFTGFFGAAVSAIAAAGWQQLSVDEASNGPYSAALIGGLGGLLLGMMYETVFLSIEKELDSRVLQQVDRERQEAEVSVLKSELDPHFFFNCLNTLSYLVREDAAKAHRFVHRLSSVYKYFLLNKEKAFVSLQHEMEFLDNYQFLLRIRFDDNIRIEHAIEPRHNSIPILPCTLQVLVENAIKHNFFSEKEPLVITITLNGQFITVSNPVRPRLQAAESTQIGLRNLRMRYRIITNQNILIQKTPSKFLVKLPIVQTNHYDKSSDH